MTSQQILAAIRRKILEQSSDLVDDDTIFFNMNLAYQDLKMSSFTNDQIQSATVSLSSGVGTLPADFGTLYGPGYQSTTNLIPFEEKPIADFDRDEDGPCMTVESGSLKVKPTTTAQLIIKYWPTYDDLTVSQNPELHSYLHELIIYGAMFRIFEDLQNEALAQFYKEEYKREIAERTAKISHYQEDNATGGQLFNGISII